MNALTKLSALLYACAIAALLAMLSQTAHAEDRTKQLKAVKIVPGTLAVQDVLRTTPSTRLAPRVATLNHEVIDKEIKRSLYKAGKIDAPRTPHFAGAYSIGPAMRHSGYSVARIAYVNAMMQNAHPFAPQNCATMHTECQYVPQSERLPDLCDGVPKKYCK